MTFDRTSIIYLALIGGVIGLLLLYVFIYGDLLGTKSDMAKDAQRIVPTESAYTDLDGNPVHIEDLEGKVLVVNAWASWCPFCRDELPDLSTLASEYPDVTVIAINRKESQKTAEAFVRTGVTGDISDIEIWLDSDDFFYKSIGGFSMPETVFYDRKGNVAVHKRGVMGLDEMRQHTETALKGKESE